MRTEQIVAAALTDFANYAAIRHGESCDEDFANLTGRLIADFGRERGLNMELHPEALDWRRMVKGPAVEPFVTRLSEDDHAQIVDNVRETVLDYVWRTKGGREVPVNGIRHEGTPPSSVVATKETAAPEVSLDWKFLEELELGPQAADPVAADPVMWLKERLHFWQRQLRLQDWDIAAEFATYQELGANNCGLLWSNRESKEARIRILRPEETPPASQIWGDWSREKFLVHELVHLYYLDWQTSNDREDPIYIAKEQAVEMLAGAFVSLAQGTPR